MATRVPNVQLHGPGGRFVQRNQGIQWVGLDVIANNINRRGKTLNNSRRRAMERLGVEMENYAKRNAPWRDHSGSARDGLKTTVVHDEGRQQSTVYLGHSVDYGLFLETMQGGRFAIIMPTVLAFSQRLISTVREVDTAQAGFGRTFGSVEE